MEKWVGSLAVVTGASAGIGAAISTELVKAGINVVGIGRQTKKIEEQAETLSDEPGKLHALYCDLTDEQQILDAFKWIEDTLGPISILINNAGLLIPTTLSEGDVQAWKDVVNVNVLACCICQRQAIKSMKENGIDGVIINMSSVTGLKVPEMATSELLINIYPATKHALHSITDTLRLELRKESSKIRVSVISPGIVVTELYRSFPLEEMVRVADYPMLKSEDIAKAVVYILSTPTNVQVRIKIIRHILSPWYRVPLFLNVEVTKRLEIINRFAFYSLRETVFITIVYCNMEQWVGATAIVTGASSGIGAAIAKKFVESGINVVGIGRRKELLDALSESVSTEDTKFYPFQCDVMDEEQILSVFDYVENTLCVGVSILINNAGINNGSTTIEDGDIEVWRQVISTNCIGLSIFTREAIKSMKAHNIDGLIIHISSIAGRYVFDLPSKAYYQLSPGVTLTDLFRNHRPVDLEQLGTMPFMQPEDIAEAAMYILSTPPSVQIQELIVRPVGEFI
ncbi:hypothetical protein FQR65_LT11593 [Abscondita terminalis]|nr:hypothetical protein FQR65_LT11593 [Abscondita terminalis]